MVLYQLFRLHLLFPQYTIGLIDFLLNVTLICRYCLKEKQMFALSNRMFTFSHDCMLIIMCLSIIY